MIRECEGCGEDISHLRPVAKSCSSKCRKRRSARILVGNSPEPIDSPLVDQTILTLTQKGLLDSFEGQLALVLATRIARSSLDSGSSMASLSKEFRQLMNDPKIQAVQAQDPLDELRARRKLRDGK